MRVLAFLLATTALAQQPRDYPVQPVPFTAVHLNDVFWAPRIETNRTVTIPFAFQKCEETGRVDNFERAAAGPARRAATNKKPPGYPVRRHRSLQGDRRRRLRAQRAARSQARRLRRRPDRQDRRRAGDRTAISTPRARSIPSTRIRWAGKKRWELEKRATATSSTTSATSTRRPPPTIRPPASGRCSTSP